MALEGGGEEEENGRRDPGEDRNTSVKCTYLFRLFSSANFPLCMSV